MPDPRRKEAGKGNAQRQPIPLREAFPERASMDFCASHV